MSRVSKSKAVTLNPEQRLYVIPCGSAFTCLGFDVCYRDALQLAQVLGTPLPDKSQVGTVAQYTEYQSLINEYGKRPDLNSKTWFSPRTPLKVQKILEQARVNNQRLRIFLGDPDTGVCWLEEHDVVGYIGRSMGTMRIPLLIHNQRSHGGGAILTDCIVRILDSNCKELWRHVYYQVPDLKVASDSTFPKYPWQTFNQGGTIARFATQEKANHWVSFMQGTRLRP